MGQDVIGNLTDLEIKIYKIKEIGSFINKRKQNNDTDYLFQATNSSHSETFPSAVCINSSIMVS